MRTVVDDIVTAVKDSDPSEEAVHAAIDAELELLDLETPEEILRALGMVTVAQYKYIDTHVRLPQHQVRQGRRPDKGAPVKVAAIKTFAHKFYKEEIA